jgi:hypothetical protein
MAGDRHASGTDNPGLLILRSRGLGDIKRFLLASGSLNIVQKVRLPSNIV